MTPNYQDVDEEDRGLLYDLPALISRRRALGSSAGWPVREPSPRARAVARR